MAGNTSSVITGARATVQNAQGKIIGIFDSCSWGAALSLEDIHILGRYTSAEITVTSYNAVSVQCSGYRVYNASQSNFSPDEAVGTGANFPLVQNLLNLQDFTLSVYDRQNPTTPIAVIQNCVPQSFNNSVNARTVSKLSMSYMGVLVYDETGPQGESAGAATLPGSDLTNLV